MRPPFRQGRLANYLSVAILAFMAAFLLLPTAKSVNNLYYFTVGIPGIAAFFLYHRNIRFLTPIETWMALLMAWNLVIAFHHQDVEYFRNIIHVTAFFFTLSFFSNDSIFHAPCVKVGLYLSLAAYILLSTATSYFNGGFSLGVRQGDMLSRLDGPIYTAMLLVAFYGLLVPLFLKKELGGHIGLIAGFLITMTICALLLQTRSALMGLSVIVLFIAAGSGFYCKKLFLSLLVILLAVAAILMAFPNAIQVGENLLLRKDAFRLELWNRVLEQWQACSHLFGCGKDYEIMNRLSNGQRIHHPHNIFFSQAFYTGWLSLVLMTGMSIAALHYAMTRQHDWALYLIAGLTMLSFDGSLFIGSPDPAWLLFILPLAVLAATQRNDLFLNSGNGQTAPDGHTLFPNDARTD